MDLCYLFDVGFLLTRDSLNISGVFNWFSRGSDCVCFFYYCYLDLERLLDLLYDRLSILQLDTQALSIGHLSPDGSCSDLDWRGLV